MLSPNNLWNFAMLEAGSSPFDIASARMLKLFSSRAVRRAANAVHTQADPFLFVDDDWLYVFFEVQRVGQPGYIAAHRTRDLVAFEALGTILQRPYHLSYPHVFRSKSGIHMVPECAAHGEVALYSFDDFPRGLRKERVLLKGPYEDSTLFHHDGNWWMFTTRDAGLELFVSPDLDSPFQPHPMNPLDREPARSRCGGAVVAWDGALYRMAQDGSEQYGGNLSALRIVEIGSETYREEIAHPSIFDREPPWRSQGAHHLSVVRFGGRTILAVDGKQHDFRINRLLSPLYGLLPRPGFG